VARGTADAIDAGHRDVQIHKLLRTAVRTPAIVITRHDGQRLLHPNEDVFIAARRDVARDARQPTLRTGIEDGDRHAAVPTFE
jgi:hypothetical protein